ncbi:3'-5' exonuclease [Kushneria marisflavi]|uniref:DNA polymerase III subunit epsilon n=1 Tax=Kushneria marisflavi TaxID=157779 RepID=A0A240UNK6_9GAMM|nr:3'-5' exonuclease [Kushneria marisflavi]ART62622.1 DNA polymerase III subunit epsilon [Kushneria marisflavi]RKD83989.1 DNA polymerase-3 subunit epsilon [Kushneria marisflavi]
MRDWPQRLQKHYRRWQWHRRGKLVSEWPAYLADRQNTTRDDRLACYFEAGTLDPQTPISEVPLVALDIETTGLDPARDSIVSIGVQPFTLNRIPVAKSHYWTVKPRRTLSSRSVIYHRLTHSDLANAPSFDKIIGEVLEQLAGRLVVVHYTRIEREFLNAAARHYLKESLLFPLIDTMAIEAWQHRRLTWFQRLIGRRPVSLRLHPSRERYNLPPYQAHHALIDALATAELLQAQIARHYAPDTPVGVLWE